MNSKTFTGTPTKLVGTSFEGRQQLLRRILDENIKVLQLERQPNNPYDSDAVAVRATFRNGESAIVGMIQNNERICLGTLSTGDPCGARIDGSRVNRSTIVVCPKCNKLQETKSRLTVDNSGTDPAYFCTCESCQHYFDIAMHRVFVCKYCGSYLNQRIGLASTIAREMEKGVSFKVKVLEVTGGDKSSGKAHYGCNIYIEVDLFNSNV